MSTCGVPLSGLAGNELSKQITGASEAGAKAAGMGVCTPCLLGFDPFTTEAKAVPISLPMPLVMVIAGIAYVASLFDWD